MRKQPRDYQMESHTALWQFLHEPSNYGKNPLVVMATGLGKSLNISMFIWAMLSRYPHLRMVQACHVKELVASNYEETMELWPECPAGVYAAALKRRDTRTQVTFAMINSVAKRAKSFGHVDFLIIDEAHRLSDNDASLYGLFIAELKKKNPNLILIGYTATDYRMKGGRLTEMGLFDEVVYDIGHGDSFVWAVDNGYLIRPVPTDPGFQVDDTDIGLSSGDYKSSEASAAMHDQDIIERAVDYSIQLAKDENRKRALIFAQSVEDADLIADMYTYKGYPTRAVHTRSGDRDDVLDAHKRGELWGVTNRDILCLSSDTEILTTDGFVGMDEMTYEHRVAAWREDGGIDWTPPEFIVRRNVMPGEKMVEVNPSSPLPKFAVTGNHRMVRCNRDGKFVAVEQAEELLGRAFKIPTCGVSKPEFMEPEPEELKTPRRRSLRSKLHKFRAKGLPRKEALEAAEREVSRIYDRRYLRPDELTIEQCQFIGFWLGDGTWGDPSQPKCSFSQSGVNMKVVLWFNDLCEKLGYDYKFKSRASKHVRRDGTTCGENYRWSFPRGTGGESQKRRGVYEIEPYLNKRGSRLYVGLNKHQIEAILYGLWMADGSHREGGTTNKVIGTQYEMFNTLQEVCVQRGISASITPLAPPKKENHNQQYRFTWNGRQAWHYHHDGTYMRGTSSDERVWCITSSTSYLICRRGGKVFITGNTTGYNDPWLDLMVCLRLTRSPGLWVQMVGRMTRPAWVNHVGNNGGPPLHDISTLEGRLNSIRESGKLNARVLDFCGNTERLGPINFPNIPKARKKGVGGDAPVRTCKNCEPWTFHHTSVKVCPECGFEFPVETKLHTMASKSALVSDANPLGLPEPEPKRFETFSVHEMTATFNEGKGDKLDTMRVTYRSGVSMFKTWVCFEHPDKSFPRRKAEEWWLDHGGQGPAPRNIEEALEQAGDLTMPKFINVWTNTKYPEIAGYDFIGHRFEPNTLDFTKGGINGQILHEPDPDPLASVVAQAQTAAFYQSGGGYYDEDIPF